MSDTIKSIPAMRATDDAAVSDAARLGLVTLSDNHGNSYTKANLTCAHKARVPLGFYDEVRVDDELAKHEHFAFWNSLIHLEPSPEGIPVQFGEESPLQTMCRKLDAAARHAPKANPPARGK